MIKLGMIGTGRIASRFVAEARVTELVEIVSVYNPHEGSAKRFALDHQILHDTDDLIDFADKIDAVYIATPHETHYSYAKEMLLRGKHVLCEKPMGFSKKEVEELFEIAKARDCVLMEAIKTAYCPGFIGLLDVIKSGAIGKVRDVEACFSRISPTNVREMTDVAYGGSFIELSRYPLLPIIKLLGTEYDDVDFWSVTGANGLDIYTKANVRYKGAMGLAKTGLHVKSEGQLVVAGSKGYILAPSPWWLTKHFEVRHEDPKQVESYDFPYEGAGLRYEIEVFAKRIRKEETIEGVLAKESAVMADILGRFMSFRKTKSVQINENGLSKKKQAVKIWAHRGCSMDYPENTLMAFRAAAEVKGITGIELDVQLSKDGVPVVIHDETVNRTTDGNGNVRDFTLQELQGLKIAALYEGQIGAVMSGNVRKEGEVSYTTIPTLEEVFELLQPYCEKNGLLINIELKNSKIRYEGMEEKVLALVRRYGLEDSIVYSSFLPESMGLIRELAPTAQTAILGTSMNWCLEQMEKQNADAIHPWIGGLDIEMEAVEAGVLCDVPVRAWNAEEPFFGQDRPLKEKNLPKYASFGVTDIITNVPKMYLE